MIFVVNVNSHSVLCADICMALLKYTFVYHFRKSKIIDCGKSREKERELWDFVLSNVGVSKVFTIFLIIFDELERVEKVKV